MKEKLGIEENTSVERAHRASKIQRRENYRCEVSQFLEINQGLYVLTKKRRYGKKKSL